MYLIYNGLTTGNPVFPYYNSIFRSPYFGTEDFKDRRWGPSGRREILLWPWYMIRYPEYRLSEIFCEYNLDLAVFYLLTAGLLAAVLFVLWKKGCSGVRAYGTELTMLLLYGVSMAAWTVTTGHIRYFMAGLVLAGVIAACLFLRLADSGRAVLLAAGLLLMIPFGKRASYGYEAVWKGREWALRDSTAMLIPCMSPFTTQI